MRHNSHIRRQRSDKGTLAMALAIATAGLAAMLLQGCNTMEGIGEDISASGQSMADVAHDANPEHK